MIYAEGVRKNYAYVHLFVNNHEENNYYNFSGSISIIFLSDSMISISSHIHVDKIAVYDIAFSMHSYGIIEENPEYSLVFL